VCSVSQEDETGVLVKQGWGGLVKKKRYPPP
jgi:hypothetical protein